jgi:cystathionine beta-lyase
MRKNIKGINTICTHVGEIEDEQFGGAISPIYTSTSYAYIDADISRYPRYSNTPNQEYLSKKIAALEETETAMIFGSGMAAISTTLLSFLNSGDHILFQNDIYGGTRNLAEAQFDRYGIEYSFTEGLEASDFEKKIKENTKVIYIESPSNPILKIVDIKAVAQLAKSRNILSIIDNTFATPVIQKPSTMGIDVVLHSATKYFGGHSDICAGAVATSEDLKETIWSLSKNLGGSLSDYTVWLLERSMKTLVIRVKAQQENAMKLSKYLYDHKLTSKVYYPGLPTHKNHDLAKKQMNGFGAMMSFEFNESIHVNTFLKSLKLIKPSMSLAGIESTMLVPAETSHFLLKEEDRLKQGITNNLIRFSVGIEDTEDIIQDIEQAIVKATNK